MTRVLIFGGATEGRELAETLERSRISCEVCVATDYGAQVMRESEYLRVRQGRLDAEQMRRLYETLAPEVVVDATHPYATLVSQTIRASLAGLELPCLRLRRSSSVVGDAIVHADMRSCADALRSTTGRVALTTGSKELAPFCEDPELRARVVARVLPSLESLRLCYAAGLDGRQIVAMHGPFTRETNEAFLRQYDVKYLVTKESGALGGEDAKLHAARNVGVEVHVVARPESGDESGMAMEDVVKRLEALLGVPIAVAPLDVVLAGVGCGSSALMTEEVRARIEASDYLFGAPRMLEGVAGAAIRRPVFLKDDVVPALAEIRAQRGGGRKVTVLFSGDPGFYSGCERLYPALKALDGVNVRVMPGVSSVTTLAARLGIAWQDAAIMSLHGVDESRWSSSLKASARENRKTFFITSGVSDVRRVGALLADVPGVRALLGFQLSYPDEKLYDLAPCELVGLDGDGLWVGALLQSSPTPRPLVPTLRDDDFARDLVPMTKEKVRKLAICQMKLAPGQVVYDIGAGSGSIAIQAALVAPSARVYAVERADAAVALIRRNVAALGATNVDVVQATAPEGLDALPRGDVAFIGGSGGRLDAILEKLCAINPEMRVVMTAVSLESVAQMNALTKRFPVADLDVAQIAVDQVRQTGEYRMLQANNPVFLFSFNFRRQ